jgi:oxygen-independent coproporphyrinogen-3 oxidase
VPPQEGYTEKLLQEMQLTADKWRSAALSSIYVGGGTPTLLKGLVAVVEAAKKTFGVTQDCEITVETDPGTLDQPLLDRLIGAGVNRFSVGVQILNDAVLKASGRAHTTSEVHQTLDLLKAQSGISVSVDVIVGLPHSTEKDWETTLDQVLAWDVDHVSTYLLTLEDGTPFSKKYIEGVQPLPSVDSVCDMYLRGHDRLTQAGYVHYEISNFAKAGKESRHNLNYWEGNSFFYGVGLGAASFVDSSRHTRPKRLKPYYDWVDAFATHNFPVQSQIDQLKDTLMYQIRRRAGVDAKHIASTYGATSLLDQLAKQYPELLRYEADFLKLTGPEAYLLSNEVLSTAFALLE